MKCIKFFLLILIAPILCSYDSEKEALYELDKLYSNPDTGYILPIFRKEMEACLQKKWYAAAFRAHEHHVNRLLHGKKYKMALKCIKEAQYLFQNISDIHFARSLELESSLWKTLGDYEEATYYMDSVITQLPKFNDPLLEGWLLYLNADLLSNQNLHTEAECEALNSISVYKTINHTQCIAESQQLLGKILFDQGKIEEALKAFRASMNSKLYHPFVNTRPNNFLGMGLSFEQFGEIDSALFYFNKTAEISKQMELPKFYADAQFGMSRCELAAGNIDKARKHIEMGRFVSDTLKNYELIKEAHVLSARIYQHLGKWRQALYHFNMVDEANENYSREQNTEVQEVVAERMALRDYRDDLEFNIIQSSLDAIETKKRYGALIIVGSIVILLGVFIEMLRKNVRLIQRNNRLLSMHNAEIGKQNRTLESINTQLREKEFELKGELKQIQNLLDEIRIRVSRNMDLISKMLHLQNNKIDHEKANKVLSESINRIKSMSLIHESFFIQDKNSVKRNFRAYVRTLINQLLYSYSDTDKRVELQLEAEEVNIHEDDIIPCGLIINEAITNSLKHAFDKTDNPQIYISLKQTDGDMINLHISDNGSGLPENLNIDELKSLGLQLIESLSEQLDGTLKYYNEEGAAFDIRWSTYH